MTATTRASGLRGYSSLVRVLGGDPEKLCRECGLSHKVLGDEDALIPHRQYIYLLEHTATQLSVPDCGLRLAATQDIGILGPTAIAMQNSGTVAEAMQCAANYLFMQAPELSMDIEVQGDISRVQLNVHLSNMPHSSMIQVEDLTIGVTHGIFQLLAQDYYLPVRIELPHRPLCSTTVYEKFFGTEVVFATERNAVFVETSTMKINLANRSELLRQMATQFLDIQLPSPDGLLSTRVSTAVRRTLGTDSCNRPSIARAMAITPRTLSRRLQQEGESFDGLRDRVRRERTEYYLCETNAPLAQVAALMGYSEQSTLTRSCQRWFGATPLKVRSESC